MLLRPLLTQGGFDETRRRRRLAFLQFSDQDTANLREIHTFAQKHIDAIVEEFYAHLLQFEETRSLLADPKLRVHLKETQRAYFLRMTEGLVDADYFESRLRVGDMHQQIDLNPEWYLGTFRLYLQLVQKRLRQEYQHDLDRLFALNDSLTKVMFLDMGLAIDAYIMGGFVHRALAHEYRRMAEVAERTLREKDEVERMKAELSNMIVHDLKGPLGGILTVTQLALRKRGAVADAHARHFEQIQRSARDLLRMIENLLEIDKMQDNRLDLRIEPVEVGALLEECAVEFTPSAEVNGQSVAISVGDDVPVIATDRWLLRRVLNNLVVNAIRHSGAAGLIELGAELQDGTVRLRVRDNGRGIAAENLMTLFQKSGRRRDPANNREDTGLGLVFCKMAAETLGGSIGVESAEGEGATFIVSLPAIADR